MSHACAFTVARQPPRTFAPRRPHRRGSPPTSEEHEKKRNARKHFNLREVEKRPGRGGEGEKVKPGDDMNKVSDCGQNKAGGVPSAG